MIQALSIDSQIPTDSLKPRDSQKSLGVTNVTRGGHIENLRNPSIWG